MKTGNVSNKSVNARKAASCAALSFAMASALVPAASLGAASLGDEAVADTSITNSSAYAHLSGVAPQCVIDCISGYLNGDIDKDTLISALSDLADEGRITRTQLNAYLAMISEDDIDGLKECIKDFNDANKDLDSDDSSSNGSDDDTDSDDSDDKDAAPDEDVKAPSDADGADDADNGSGAEDDATGDDSDSAADDKTDDADSEEATDQPDGNAAQTPKEGTTRSSKSIKHPLANDSSKDDSDKEASEKEGKTSQTPKVKVTRATHDLTTEQFISVIGEQARQIGQDHGIYASVMIAQAILESGSGSSLLSSAPFYNLFGIKGTYMGNGVDMKTSEDDGTGNYYTITATFRDYGSYSESLQDYATLLTEENVDFYAGALKASAKTPQEAAEYLQGRYATSTSYADSINAIIETYRLERYDEPLPYETDRTYFVDVLDEEGNTVRQERTIADLLAVATTYLGRDYVWGGSTPETGFDCSGLVQYSYSEALGISLPRTTYVQCKVGQEVDMNDLHPGDLLFFDSDGDIHHVGMYLGNGFFIHAPQTGDVIKVTALEDYSPSFAIRVIPTHERTDKAENVEEQSNDLKDASESITGMLDTVMSGVGSTIADNVAVLIEDE